MAPPLLRTKLYFPLVRTELVPRPRLFERLDAGFHGKLTLVSAPAGFGKTTLLSAWLSNGRWPAAWLSLDEGDDDYHLIDAHPIHKAMTFFLNHQPQNIHLVIATRSDPFLRLSRLRARGQMIELRTDDLRFTPQKAAVFLNQAIIYQQRLMVEPGGGADGKADKFTWRSFIITVATDYAEPTSEQLVTTVP